MDSRLPQGLRKQVEREVHAWRKKNGYQHYHYEGLLIDQRVYYRREKCLICGADIPHNSRATELKFENTYIQQDVSARWPSKWMCLDIEACLFRKAVRDG